MLVQVYRTNDTKKTLQTENCFLRLGKMSVTTRGPGDHEQCGCSWNYSSASGHSEWILIKTHTVTEKEWCKTAQFWAGSKKSWNLPRHIGGTRWHYKLCHLITVGDGVTFHNIFYLFICHSRHLHLKYFKYNNVLDLF